MSPRAKGIAAGLLSDCRALVEALQPLRFSAPVHTVYQPLDYAWKPWEKLVRRHYDAPKRVVFLGMNPGPFGMAQTGIPFGEVSVARDWLQLEAPVGRPDPEHPKRPITGFACTRAEVSGQRLWGLFRERFGTPEAFFAEHAILNHCPLVFLGETGRNITPDKLVKSEREALTAACDEALIAMLKRLAPEHAVGIGAYAEAALKRVLERCGLDAQLSRVLHPSPASPLANRGWAAAASAQLREHGVWPD